MQVEVPRLEFAELSPGAEEPSARVRERVEAARERQRERFKELNLSANGEMSHQHLERFCRLGKTARAMLRTAYRQLGLSVRAHDRILRVARTIADLEGSGDIQEVHLAEAIQYRSLDRRLFG